MFKIITETKEIKTIVCDLCEEGEAHPNEFFPNSPDIKRDQYFHKKCLIEFYLAHK